MKCFNYNKRFVKRTMFVTAGIMGMAFTAPIHCNLMKHQVASVIEARAAQPTTTTTFSKYWFQDETGNWKVRDAKGNLIQDVGVKPTVEVSLDLSYYANPTAENDNQLQEAIKQLLQ